MSYPLKLAPLLLPVTLACTVSAAAAPPAVGVPWATVRAQTRPRPISTRTALVAGRQPAAIIVIPADPAYADAGQALQREIETRQGVVLPLVRGDSLVSGPCFAFTPEVLRPLADGGRNLLLLGDLNSNPAVTRLYFEYVAFEDAAYPGTGGHTVRTLVDPEGLGWNAVVLGGPGPAEVAAAVTDYLNDLHREGDSLYSGYALRVVFGSSPFLPEIRRRTESIAAQLASWGKYWLKPDSPEYRQQCPDKAPHEYVFDRLNVPLIYGGLHYALTGAPAFAEAVGKTMDVLFESLDWIEANRTAGYDDHYMVEIWLRAWQQVANSPCLTPEQRQHGAVVMAFLAGQMAMYQVDLGAYGKTTYRALSRHEYAGVFAGDALCRYVRRHSELGADLTAVLAGNRANFGTVIGTMLEGYTDGFDHKWGLDANWHLLQQTVEEPRPAYVDSGLARANADFAAMCINNAGAFVNFGADNVGPTEPYDSWQTIGRAAVLYREEGVYQWLLDHKMKRPPYKVLIMGMPYLAHWYQAAGPSREPAYLKGLNRILVDRLLYEDLVAGHGRLYAGLPVVNEVPREQTFNKITCRDGLDDDDQYLLLDGLGGVTYSGNDANAICEYSRYGERLLVQIDTKPDPFYQNLVSVSRGNAGASTGTFARLLDYADFAAAAFVRSQVSPLCGDSYQRALVLEKGGYFVVFDDLTVREAGEAAITCNFRSLGTPVLDPAARTWDVAGERAALHLQNLAVPGVVPPPTYSVAERFSGANPEQWSFRIKMLREIAARRFEAGETYRFANLFYGVRAGETPPYRAVALSRDTIAVCGVRNLVYGVPLGGEARVGALEISASMFRLAADSAQFIGLHRLRVGGATVAEFEPPVTLDVDVAAAVCRLEATALQPAGTIVWAPAWRVRASLVELARGVSLPTGGSVRIDLGALGQALEQLLAAPAEPSTALAVTGPAGGQREAPGPPRLETRPRPILRPGPELKATCWSTLEDGRDVLVCCRADGHLLAVDLSGRVVLDLATGKAPLLSVWAGRLDGRQTVLCGAQDGTILACDAAGTVLWQKQNTHMWYGQQPAVYSLAVADFAGDGRQAIAVGTHGGVSLLDRAGEFQRFTQAYAHAVFPVEAVAFYEPSRTWLLVNTWGGGLKLVDPVRGLVPNGWASFWGGSAAYQQLHRLGPEELCVIHAGTIGVGCGRLRRAGLEADSPTAATVWEPGSWYKRTDGDTRGVLVHDPDGDGRPEIVTGNEAGFLVAYDLAGNVTRRQLVGSAVSGIVAAPGFGYAATEFVVTGDTPGLSLFDRDWQVLGCWTPASGSGVLTAWPIGKLLVVHTADGAVAALESGP